MLGFVGEKHCAQGGRGAGSAGSTCSVGEVSCSTHPRSQNGPQGGPYGPMHGPLPVVALRDPPATWRPSRGSSVAPGSYADPAGAITGRIPGPAHATWQGRHCAPAWPCFTGQGETPIAPHGSQLSTFHSAFCCEQRPIGPHSVQPASVGPHVGSHVGPNASPSTLRTPLDLDGFQPPTCRTASRAATGWSSTVIPSSQAGLGTAYAHGWSSEAFESEGWPGTWRSSHVFLLPTQGSALLTPPIG